MIQSRMFITFISLMDEATYSPKICERKNRKYMIRTIVVKMEEIKKVKESRVIFLPFTISPLKFSDDSILCAHIPNQRNQKRRALAAP